MTTGIPSRLMSAMRGKCVFSGKETINESLCRLCRLPMVKAISTRMLRWHSVDTCWKCTRSYLWPLQSKTNKCAVFGKEPPKFPIKNQLINAISQHFEKLSTIVRIQSSTSPPYSQNFLLSQHRDHYTILRDFVTIVDWYSVRLVVIVNQV